MESLTVLYDPSCPTCARAKAWLEARAQLVRLDFVPAGSDRALARFPHLDHQRTLRDITVIADDGAVFAGPKAWVMCLWALRDYRAAASVMSWPALYPFARMVIDHVSRRVAAQRALREPQEMRVSCDC